MILRPREKNTCLWLTEISLHELVGDIRDHFMLAM